MILELGKIIFLTILLASFCCVADNRNRNLFPLGQKEAFLANTGTALSNSLGAVYYNPGALAGMSKNQMGLFGSTYFYSEFNADAFTYQDGTDIPFKSYSSASKPTSYVAGFKSGGYTLAVSILVPGAAKLASFSSWATPNGRITTAQTLDSDETWFGFSAAKKISQTCGLGLSAFFIKANSMSQSFKRVVLNATPNLPIIEMTYITSEVNNALATVGVLCQVADSDVDFGLRVQSPSVRISGKSDILYTADTVLPVSHTEIRDYTTSTNYYLPLDVSLGVGMRPSRWNRIYMDISVQDSSNYDILPGNRFNQTRATQSALRYNLGTEMLVSSTTSVLLGWAYNPSANQVVENRVGDEKSDYFEATLGLQYSSGPMSMGIGSFYLWSTGERVIRSTYDKGETQTKILGALLTTAYTY